MDNEKEICIGPYRIKGTDSHLVAMDAVNKAISQGNFSAHRERSVAISGKDCVVSVLPQFRDQPPTIQVKGADGQIREFPRVNFR